MNFHNKHDICGDNFKYVIISYSELKTFEFFSVSFLFVFYALISVTNI